MILIRKLFLLTQHLTISDVQFHDHTDKCFHLNTRSSVSKNEKEIENYQVD